MAPDEMRQERRDSQMQCVIRDWILDLGGKIAMKELSGQLEKSEYEL